MAQDQQGYLWLGTNEGLVRFDGTEFKLFSADDIAGLQAAKSCLFTRAVPECCGLAPAIADS